MKSESDLDLTSRIGSDWKMNKYYERAEQSDWLATFWDKNSIFKKRFNKLDTSSIAELACGHGRHVPQYYFQANKIYLLDINEENIDYCKTRFGKEDKITYLVNSGKDFSDIPSNSLTSIFSYDAMVHFDILDIASYIKDTARVLKKGGRFLFHHSNYDKAPGNYYSNNPSWRNFMSANIFVHFSKINNFKIISQDILDWYVREGNGKDLDCLTLCEKL